MHALDPQPGDDESGIEGPQPDWLFDPSDLDGLGPVAEVPRPFNWDTLPPVPLEAEWHALDGWVTWLRRTYGLPATVLPPAWHRHPELVRELSALHLHWQGAYQPDSHASAPLGWHRDLADAINRLRDWTAASGTGLNHDRPTRHTPWPGDPDQPAEPERPLHDRQADFDAHVAHHVAQRRATMEDPR